MVKFVLFLKKIYVLLLFVVLESICLHYYAGSSDYTKSRLMTLSNSMVGSVYQAVSYVGNYFTLGRENRLLTEEMARLRNQLAAYEGIMPDTVKLSAFQEIAPYQYIQAKVIGNSVTRQDNHILLNKGLRDEVDADMAVISPDGGIVGYVTACSEKFASCISVLSRDFRTSGKFKRADYVGSVHWDGISPEYVMLSDIPKYAEMVQGDTIVTSNYSSIFPPGLMIGTVEGWKMNDQTYCYDVKVKLMPRIASLNHVLLVRYMDSAERGALENPAGNQK